MDTRWSRLERRLRRGLLLNLIQKDKDGESQAPSYFGRCTEQMFYKDECRVCEKCVCIFLPTPRLFTF